MESAEAERLLRVWMSVNGDNHWQRLRDAMSTVLAELSTLRAALEKERQWSELLARGKSPCGHWSAYALSENGGQTIQCLKCERDNFQVEVLSLRAALAQQEQGVIDQVVSHWFAQGGEAQFGAIADDYHNADEVVSAILSVVRAALASHEEKIRALEWEIESGEPENRRRLLADTHARAEAAEAALASQQQENDQLRSACDDLRAKWLQAEDSNRDVKGGIG